MPTEFQRLRRLFPTGRIVIEVGFIMFLFYANLLMGEFNRSNRTGKTLLVAVRDIFTPENFIIAIGAALIGHVLFEVLRKKI